MTVPAAPGPGVRRIRIERRGGYAGLPAAVGRDYVDLSAAQRAAVDKLAAAGPAPLQGGGPPAALPPGADRFSFRVRLDHADGSTREMEIPEEAMPASLAALAKPALP